MYERLTKDPCLPVPNPTRSFWQLPPHETLKGIQSSKLPSQRDTVIIGSGITGCSVSRELLTNGFHGSITVLEAREVCSGATGRNGGRINCVAVLDFDKYRQKFGDAIAKDIVRFQLAHYDEILEAAKELGAEVCEKTEVRQVETVAAIFSQQKLLAFKAMLANFEAAFPDLAGKWKIVDKDTDKKYHIQGAKGALIGEAGVAWSYRFVSNIFVKLLHDYPDRFTVETSTPALSVSRNPDNSSPYTIRTPRGEIVAKHVIHCTEGHTSHLLAGLRGILVPRRGQMTVQNPGMSFKHTDGQRSWSFYFDQGFDYLSQNAKSGQIFIGGGDVGGIDGALAILGAASDAEEGINAKSHLAGILPVVFGRANWGEQRLGKPLLEASWSGIMCNSLDGVPLVGMVPQEAIRGRSIGSREKGAEWMSAGYGGYGMVNGWRCGKAVAQQLMGMDTSLWLPSVYQVSPERITRLASTLSQVTGSEKHLRALL